MSALKLMRLLMLILLMLLIIQPQSLAKLAALALAAPLNIEDKFHIAQPDQHRLQRDSSAICTPTPSAALATRSARYLAPARTDFSTWGVGIWRLSVLMKIVLGPFLAYLPTALSVSVNQPRS